MDSTILSLCSGGGGLDLGVHMALTDLRRGRSPRTVAYVEVEAYACAVLVARMEAGDLDAAPLWTNLRTFPSRQFCGCVDGIVAGYPCQPFSVAGKRRGSDDPRHLWPSIRDHIEVIQPIWCFFENVPGHLRLGLREVIGDLQSLGYRVAATLVTAKEVEAPHKRERLFILANSHYDRREWAPIHLLMGQQRETVPDTVGTSTNVADTDINAWNERWSSHFPKESRGWNIDRSSLGPPSGWWATEPDVGRVAHGVAARVDRLRLLGNGVVPQQAAYAFTLLANELGTPFAPTPLDR